MSHTSEFKRFREIFITPPARLTIGVIFEFYTVIKEMIKVKCISFTKTPLLIIVSGIVIYD